MASVRDVGMRTVWMEMNGRLPMWTWMGSNLRPHCMRLSVFALSGLAAVRDRDKATTPAFAQWSSLHADLRQRISLRLVLPLPRCSGLGWFGPGFHPMKKMIWNVAGTDPSSLP